MRKLRVRNYYIETPLIDILYEIKRQLTNGKLREISPAADGENITCTCPSSEHKNGQEHSASCNVYIGNDMSVPYGLAKCWSCGFTVSFPKFVSECFDSSLDYAEQWLIQKYGVSIADAVELDEPIQILKTKIKPVYVDKNILAQYQDYCPYLAERGISRETAKKFSIKYDQKTRQVVFPLFDEKDNLLGLLTRSIDRKQFYIPKGQEKLLYCWNNVIKNKYTSIILTEGLFDTLKGNQFAEALGIGVVGTLGMVSQEQINRINKSDIKFVYGMFDSDAAGKQFAAYVKSKLSKRIIYINIPIPSGKKDLGELTKEDFEKIAQDYLKNRII